MLALRVRTVALWLTGVPLFSHSVAIADTNPPPSQNRALSTNADAAKRHFDRAAELIEEGLFEAAVVEFQRAYKLAPHYSVLYNIGQAYVGLGRPVKAATALQRYLDEGGQRIDPATRAAVEEELERQRGRIATLTLNVTPNDAEVSVDGEVIGTAPLPNAIEVAVGTHVISAAVEGHAPKETTVSVAGGDQRTITLSLSPHPIEAPLPGQPEGPLRPSQIPDERSESVNSVAPPNHTLAYALGSAGLSLGLAAGVVVWVRSDHARDWKERQQALDAETEREGADFLLRQEVNNERANTINALDNVTLGLAIPAAALLSGSAILFLTGRESSTRLTPEIHLANGESALRLSGRF